MVHYGSVASLGVLSVDYSQVVVELLNELIVFHGLVYGLLVLLDFNRDGGDPLPHLCQLLDRVRLLVQLARDQFELLTRLNNTTDKISWNTVLI